MKETLMKKTYTVTGMTCGHCAGAVTEEISALEGVESVEVDLVAGGASSVHVTSAGTLDDAAVAAAVDEAGNYQVVES
ncbi:heavy-metal-associated domain-containing protein [Mumia sp. DW29H23]|uniref:heavy-metal-associated domain-containing protein n=1 Tax=Mumia sp. DW29H23 TaxID=3421241 RepID=UPI003D68A219